MIQVQYTFPIKLMLSSFFLSLTIHNRLCFFTTHCSLRLVVRSELDVPTFATRRLHACHHARAPSGGRWNCGRKISGNFA